MFCLISFRSGNHQGLGLAPGLLTGILAFAAVVIASVSSRAAVSRKSVIASICGFRLNRKIL
jgi:hypothetical protein